MKKIIAILVAVLIVLEGVGWLIYKKSKEGEQEENAAREVAAAPSQAQPLGTRPFQPQLQAKDDLDDDASLEDLQNFDPASFPPPAVEIVDGVSQRTIHMGVRQWAWDPAEITVDYGEKVILIMHNADVPHSISIPDLGVKEAIPAEGAVVIFTADKRGTFDFFCDVPCGKGHGQMKGKMIVA